MSDTQNVLILGGAGFIGSAIVERFCSEGYDVTVIDGLLRQSGGSRDNLAPVLSRIRFIESRIEEIANLDELVSGFSLVIDCMAWTSHHLALENPLNDLQLNASSHLYLINAIKDGRDTQIIFLGSRGQYGNPGVEIIREDTPMSPEDIQGVHKLAAESYYRIYAKFKNLNVVSLRLPNCFGENQPVIGPDIGLVGSFVRDLLSHHTLEVYGERKRFLAYAGDVAEIVFKLSRKGSKGFCAYNMGGQELTIQQLVAALISVIGSGSFVVKDVPEHIKAIDMGNARISEDKLQAALGDIEATDLFQALSRTVDYFKRQL